ncbi:hypothetical protein DEU56DRAFT_919836 [Suillus clintonianus]|uniref:uncharacterized protein n=1 Tax=Suillus clintonianus TaxID=1904413 RepID=UPI001B881A37|nr:uncharacterized protein DEU56DRAFT_919836 [Suillus clintonianus]KAG2112431.1 hypothetical protein DEU56DRAFT_919836 [Suillus clintonianus]
MSLDVGLGSFCDDYYSHNKCSMTGDSSSSQSSDSYYQPSHTAYMCELRVQKENNALLESQNQQLEAKINQLEGEVANSKIMYDKLLDRLNSSSAVMRTPSPPVSVSDPFFMVVQVAVNTDTYAILNQDDYPSVVYWDHAKYTNDYDNGCGTLQTESNNDSRKHGRHGLLPKAPAGDAGIPAPTLAYTPTLWPCSGDLDEDQFSCCRQFLPFDASSSADITEHLEKTSVSDNNEDIVPHSSASQLMFLHQLCATMTATDATELDSMPSTQAAVANTLLVTKNGQNGTNLQAECCPNKFHTAWWVVNLCGIEWKKTHKKITVGEFSIYWTLLAGGDRQDYKDHSKKAKGAWAGVFISKAAI